MVVTAPMTPMLRNPVVPTRLREMPVDFRPAWYWLVPDRLLERGLTEEARKALLIALGLAIFCLGAASIAARFIT